VQNIVEKFNPVSKGVFIATQLNSTRRRVELCRYKHPLRCTNVTDDIGRVQRNVAMSDSLTDDRYQPNV